jgi:hypothetical protein
MKSICWLMLVLGLCKVDAASSQFPSGQRQLAVLIEMRSEQGTNRGSGFFMECSNKLFFVTAKHVIFNPRKWPQLELYSTNCVLTYGNNSEFPSTYHVNVDLGLALTNNEVRAHPVRDVALIHCLTTTSSKDTNGVSTYFPQPFVTIGQTEVSALKAINLLEAKMFTNVIVGSTAFTISYPSSIGSRAFPQLDGSRALYRRGSVADADPTRRIIVLDLPVYQGNSGGLVLEESRAEPTEVVNQYRITFNPIGVATQFVPFEERWSNDRYADLANVTWSNSGYSICEPMDSVFETTW